MTCLETGLVLRTAFVAVVSSVRRAEGDLVTVQREPGPLASAFRWLELAKPNTGTHPVIRKLGCARA